MINKKIAFFDIDGTLTSEIDGSIPKSAVEAVRKARDNGNLMFINTGRCFQNVEDRFKEIGFDGYVCGCGTNIYYNDKELIHIHQTHEITLKILEQARKTDVDIFFEAKEGITTDLSRSIKNDEAKSLYNLFKQMSYQIELDIEAGEYLCDKFVIWFDDEKQLTDFRKVSDLYFECIDRGNCFREFVPIGYSKATGIQYLLDYFNLDLKDVYVFGDSNNDLSMIQYAPNSVAMGNAESELLLKSVSYITKKASEDGIKHALEHFGFY